VSSLRIVDIGIDEPVAFADGMPVLDHLLERLRDGGPSAVVLAQSQAILATGDASPDVTSPHVAQQRAGGTTYFGPGVLLIAPIVRADPILLHEALLKVGEEVCARYGVTTVRRPHRPGLWVNDEQGWRKIASIGLASRDFIVGGGGGLSLNVNPAPGAWDSFDACGIRDVQMTSLAQETSIELGVADVVDNARLVSILEQHLCPILIAPEAMELVTSIAAMFQGAAS